MLVVAGVMVTLRMRMECSVIRANSNEPTEVSGERPWGRDFLHTFAPLARPTRVQTRSVTAVRTLDGRMGTVPGSGKRSARLCSCTG